MLSLVSRRLVLESWYAAPLPLSLHACMQAPVRLEPGRLDVSDLNPSLPRQELEQYRTIDDGFDLTVVLPLGEAIPKDQARILVKFGLFM